MKTSRPQLIRESDEALDNIVAFERAAGESPEVQRRLSYARAWYAVPMAKKKTKASPHEIVAWHFGPSKFIGYSDINARRYVEIARPEGPADGRDTEHRLKKWFEEVEPDSPLGRELYQALTAFLRRWNARPNKLARVSVLKSELVRHPSASALGADTLLNRISTNPDLCGGRPCVKGTRIRVSDILDMLAAGENETTILNDFPYLAKEDIAAALAYGARAADHRVIRAA